MSEFGKHPIDAVITWVDGEDDSHQKKILPYLEDKNGLKNIAFSKRTYQVEEIKFTVDSIIKFAAFIRKIYIVTDNQTPLFLKSKENMEVYKNVIIVDHKAIFKEKESFLPVFNCRPIETRLYTIPNLSEHFIYFNDDMFLIKETKPSDFFVNGFPVLRGKWLTFNENIFYKRMFTNERKKKKAGHRKAQERGAKIVGFKKCFKFHHTPYPLRKSTFINFFKENQEIETLNIKYRFRNFNQFTPQGLANHLEIKSNTFVLKNDYQLVYFQNYKKPFRWLKFKLNSSLKNKNKLFLCMQSLNESPKNKLDYIKDWLHKRYD
ncbi:MAG: Stealth CR1 domain-containing protein [Flavobacteriaceae bacterium]|nr:Stealth CR1 domain-containing protein [Flavobacteriaceae bacterium]